LQTGELYKTTELTDDGELPVLSPDGRYVGYESGARLRRLRRLIRLDGSSPPQITAELPGFGASFSIDGSKLAYLRPTASSAVAEAQAALEGASPAERAQRLNALNQILANESRLVLREIASGTESTPDTGHLRLFSVLFASSSILVTASAPAEGAAQIYEISDARPPLARTSGDTDKIFQSR